MRLDSRVEAKLSSENSLGLLSRRCKSPRPMRDRAEMELELLRRG